MRLLAALLSIVICLTAGRYQPRNTGGSSANAGGGTVTYPWRFANVADIHCRWAFGGGAVIGYRNDFQLGKIIDTLNALNVPVMVIGGDWAEDGFIANPQLNGEDSLMAKLGRYNGIILPSMGNHEAIGADTLLQRDPYYTARQRFASKFQGKNWYKYDYKNVRFIALQNSANYNISSGDDFRVNNPTTYAPPAGSGGIQGYDWDGITVPTSNQRLDLASYTTRTSVGSRWIVAYFNRPIYGSNAGNATRLNFGRAARGTGFLKAMEDSLPTSRRGLILMEEQHHTYYLTNAIADSALASATGKGFHHLMVVGGGGARIGDSTSVPSGFYDSYAFTTGTGSSVAITAGSTTGTVVDTMTVKGMPCLNYLYTWSLHTVYADLMMIETFGVWQACDSSNARYRGDGKMELIDRVYIKRDVR